jgi:C4-dicarboxylate transporter, DctM subunit
MGSIEISIILLALMILLILMGFQVGLTLILLGFIGLLLVAGAKPAFSTLAFIPYSRMSDYAFTVIPLYILMGDFVAYSGIGKQAYDLARAWLGHIRGGLALATIGACGLFAACSGSSPATALTMGKIVFPEMERLGYDRQLALGCIAAGGTLGIMIPPSTGFIIIGILAELSIGKLFIAGVLPGITQIIFYWITIYIVCWINPRFGPVKPPAPLKERLASLNLMWPVLLLVFIVMGGIYGGIFTATEAGGIGAFGAMAISLVQKKLSFSTFKEVLIDTAILSAMIGLMIVGAFVFNNFLAVSRLTYITSDLIVALQINKWVILTVIIIFYIVLGTVFDIMAIVVLTIPIFYPLLDALGFDLIWFGVITVRVMEIGMITPPFGLNLFFLAGAVKVPLGPIYRGVMPFVISDLFHVVLLVMVPQISLFLPHLMSKG